MLDAAYELARHVQRQARHLNAYDEFETFRTPRTRVSRPTPERVEALDDLHRALYGTLHPAAAIAESDRQLVEGDGEGASAESWIERNALGLAVVLLGAGLAFCTWKKPKEPPLHGPADLHPNPTPTPQSTP